MTWASVSFEHKRPAEGDFLLWYSEYMSEPVIYYFTGVNKMNQHFYFHQSLFALEYLSLEDFHHLTVGIMLNSVLHYSRFHVCGYIMSVWSTS